MRVKIVIFLISNWSTQRLPVSHLGFCYLENNLDYLCILVLNASWSRGMILYIYCGIWFPNILLKTFASIFIKAIGCDFLSFTFFSFFFFFCSVFHFGIRVMVASENECESVPFLQFWGNSLRIFYNLAGVWTHAFLKTKWIDN